MIKDLLNLLTIFNYSFKHCKGTCNQNILFYLTYDNYNIEYPILKTDRYRENAEDNAILYAPKSFIIAATMLSRDLFLFLNGMPALHLLCAYYYICWWYNFSNGYIYIYDYVRIVRILVTKAFIETYIRLKWEKPSSLL